MFKVLRKFLNLIFPKKCVGCDASNFWLCNKCRKNLKKSNQPPESWMTSIWDYKDKNIKRLLWFLKFNGRYSILDDIKKEMSDVFVSEISEKETLENFTNPLIIPIPTNRKRVRGYNQTTMIAKALLKESGLNLDIKQDILLKKSGIPPQSSIKERPRRLLNIKNAFYIKNPETIKDRNIILIDDIVTTGATLCEAKSVLEKHGAKNIVAFAIAH